MPPPTRRARPADRPRRSAPLARRSAERWPRRDRWRRLSRRRSCLPAGRPSCGAADHLRHRLVVVGELALAFGEDVLAVGARALGAGELLVDADVLSDDHLEVIPVVLHAAAVVGVFWIGQVA